MRGRFPDWLPLHRGRSGFTSRAYSAAKTSEEEDSNQDATFADDSNGTWVVLDGVSQSFHARRWVDLVGPALLWDGDLDEAVRRCATQFDAQTPEDLAWYLEDLRDVGGQGTFIKIVAQRRRRGIGLAGTALGDCMLMVVEVGARSAGAVTTWPFRQAEDMPARPPVVCSEEPHVRGGPPQEWRSSVPRRSRLYLMTDGVARYVLNQIEAGGPLHEWWPLSYRQLSQAEFREWVEHLKEADVLEDDDATIVEVQLG